MTMRVGVDSRTGLVHIAAVTAAKVQDEDLPENLLQREERPGGDAICIANAGRRVNASCRQHHARSAQIGKSKAELHD